MRADLCVDALAYADDMAIFSASFEELKERCLEFEEAFTMAGIQLNYSKTEWMIVERSASTGTDSIQALMTLKGGTISRVAEFKYLGIWISKNGRNNTAYLW